MAYYYLTSGLTVYKSVGARKVKRLFVYRKKVVPGFIQAPYIPLVRQAFPPLITNDIVKVQPMSAPIGKTFYLHFKKNRISDLPKFKITWDPMSECQFRNTIPTYKIKERYDIVFKTKHFYEIVTELMARELEK